MPLLGKATKAVLVAVELGAAVAATTIPATAGEKFWKRDGASTAGPKLGQGGDCARRAAAAGAQLTEKCKAKLGTRTEDYVPGVGHLKRDGQGKVLGYGQ